MPKGCRQTAQDLDVVFRFSGRVEGFANPLHAPLATRHRAVAFRPGRGRWKDDVSHFRGLRQENVLHDEVV